MTNFLDLSRDQIRDLCFYIFPQAEDTGEPKFSNGAIVVPVYFDGGQVTVYIHESSVVSRNRFNIQNFHTDKALQHLKENSFR